MMDKLLLILKRWYVVLLVLPIAVISMSTTAFSKEIIIKFSHDIPAKHECGIAASKFADLLNERLQGKVKVIVYPAAQLYKSDEAVEAVRRGEIQMTYLLSSRLNTIYRKMELLDLPYFGVSEGFMPDLLNQLGKEFFTPLEGKGIKVLNIHVSTLTAFAAKKPILRPEDFKGMKVRGYGKIDTDFCGEAGGIPVFMSGSEVYLSLKSGIIDAMSTGVGSLYYRNYYEVLKHVTVLKPSTTCWAYIMNKKFYDDLPADVRKVVDEVAKEVGGEWTHDHYAKTDRENLELVEKKGMILHYLSREDILEWNKVADRLYKRYESVIGKDLVEKAIRLRNKYMGVKE